MGDFGPVSAETSHAAGDLQRLSNSTTNDQTRNDNRPKGTKLRQQKLPAWEPVLTASTVIPLIIGIGVVFIPLGAALLIASSDVREVVLLYTNCDKEELRMDARNEENLSQRQTVTCRLNFNVTEDLRGDVYFYYELDNFYQNHRRYVKSRSDGQLLGNLDDVGDCDVFKRQNKSDPKSKVIAPCGALANSMFNDTFKLYQSRDMAEVPLTSDGIAWQSDRSQKFRNPPVDSQTGSLCDAFKNTVGPPNWREPPCEKKDQQGNAGFENSDFIVWMRTAALPNFRKLYRKLDKTQDKMFENGLPKGDYLLEVQYNYPVRVFNGQKRFVASTTSWMGGKNNFLGIAYLVVGSACLILAVTFVIIHVKFGQSLTDVSSVKEQ